MSLYLRTQDNDGIAGWRSLIDYMHRVFTIARHGENFWFYRLQLQLEGLDSKNLEDVTLPHIDFEVPRWLVTSWQFDEDCDESGELTYSNAEPYTWMSHRIFAQYPKPDEAAFLLKLGIDSESNRQQRDLNELVQSKDDLYYKGLFTYLGQPGMYCTQVFMADDSIFSDRELKVPSVETRIMLQVSMDPSNPIKANRRAYRGVVCEDLFCNGASFCVVAKGQDSIWGNEPGLLNPAKDQTVYISYTVDTISYARQMMAVRQIQEIIDKPTGVDMKALSLGDESPSPQVNYIAANTHRQQLKEFTRYLDQQKPRMTPMQRAAALDTTQSNSGVTGIQGPPGTGKSALIKAIGNAHVLLDRKVLYCAPHDEAVRNLVEDFDKPRGRMCEDYEMIHFTGAYHTITNADKLKLKEELRAHDPMADEDDVQVMVDGRPRST